MKKIIVVGFVLAVALLAFTQRITITERLLERGMAARIGANRLSTLEDGLHVTLCGAGGPMPALAVAPADSVYCTPQTCSSSSSPAPAMASTDKNAAATQCAVV